MDSDTRHDVTGDLQIRVATAEDREDVLGINDNVYKGSDYLPAYYDHFVASPDITPFVLIYMDKIVGFCAAHILDEGKTVVSRAVRTSPDYQGRGFYAYLDKHILEWAKSKGVTTKSFTASAGNEHIAKPTFQRECSLLLSKTFMVYYVGPKNIHLNAAQDKDVAVIPVLDLIALVSSEKAKKYLFPHDRIIVDYVPCKPLVSNIPFFKGPGAFTTMLSDVQINRGEYTGLLTSGSLYPCRGDSISFHCTIEMNGTDDASLKAHVAAHLQIVKDKADGMTRTFMVYYVEPKNIHLDAAQAQDNDAAVIPVLDLIALVSSEKAKKYLFPHDRIIVDYVPCKPLVSNIPFFKGPGDFTTMLSDVQFNRGEYTGLLTSGSLYPCRGDSISFHCTIEINGTDDASIKAHVAAHLQIVKDKADGMTRVCVIMDKRFSTESLTGIFREFGAGTVLGNEQTACRKTYPDTFLFEKKV